MNTWTLTIDAIYPSANVYLNMPSLRNGQRHYPGCNRHRQDLRDLWYWLIYEQVCALTRHENSIREARKKRLVNVYSYRHGNPDPQNMMLCADKLCADNLVKMGVLVDDSKKWCKLDAEPRRAGKEGIRTVIEIREG